MKIYELTLNGHKLDFSEDQLSLVMGTRISRELTKGRCEL